VPEDISLLPKEVERKREQEVRERILQKASLVFLIVSLIFGLGTFGYSLILKSQKSGLQEKIAVEISEISSLSEVETQAQDLGKRVGVLGNVLAEKVYFSLLLQAVAEATPVDVSVDEMTIPSAASVAVSGTSQSYVSLAQFLRNLKNFNGDGLFQTVELRSVSLDRQSGKIRFDVNLELAKEGLLK
jgi:Tfp pilus assembly protein PilN